MDKSVEEIIKERLRGKSGKEFQQLVWDILICKYPDLETVKMQNDLGNDGYSVDGKCFFAMYAPETTKYDNKITSKKISNPIPKKSEELGDYDKFLINWKDIFNFEKWIFVTRDNLMGPPHQKIVELNNNGDGIKKEQWGLDNLVKLVAELKGNDRERVFNLPSKPSQSTEVETIMDLICYISSNDSLELTIDCFENTMPDPDKKLDRFADYCAEIKNEIVENVMFAIAQKEAETAIGLDKIRIAKKVNFLRQQSRRFLRENDDNPIISLDKLADYFENELKKAGKHFDHTAIRYYLISEIPKCNVFPNKDE